MPGNQRPDPLARLDELLARLDEMAAGARLRVDQFLEADPPIEPLMDRYLEHKRGGSPLGTRAFAAFLTELYGEEITRRQVESWFDRYRHLSWKEIRASNR